MKKEGKSGGQSMQAFVRRERGSALHVQSRSITLPDGTATTGFGLNLAEAEIPDRTYEGEAAGAKYEKGLVKVFFAQPKLGEGLRSLVIITMTPAAVAQFVGAIDELNKPSMADILVGLETGDEDLTAFPDKEPDQTASLRANVVASAFSGPEACLDFYHASAFSVAALPATNKLFVEPIVRVHSSTGLVKSLIDCLRGFMEAFPANVRGRPTSND